MDDLIARAKKMKLLLLRSDLCKCLDLEDCGKVFLARPVKNDESYEIPREGGSRWELDEIDSGDGSVLKLGPGAKSASLPARSLFATLE
jgi:hypothetical protein